MTTPRMFRWRIALSAASMNDAARESALAAIQKMAPQSPLMQVPAVAASVGALATKGTALVTNAAAVAAAEQQHKNCIAARDGSRVSFDLELGSLKGLVENNAASAVDVTSMGFQLLVVAKASKTPPDPPAALVVKTGKAHGKASVVVQGKGYLGKFAAEVSTDPIGPATWTSLPGAGKQRKLTGATGTRLWVRFAAVRYGMQSDWCTPVLVTLP
jgi:hypothetical protein